MNDFTTIMWSVLIGEWIMAGAGALDMNLTMIAASATITAVMITLFIKGAENANW